MEVNFGLPQLLELFARWATMPNGSGGTLLPADPARNPAEPITSVPVEPAPDEPVHSGLPAKLFSPEKEEPARGR